MISIIVPAYNVEQHITKTLDSLCNQTYSDIEIIVVNDGSTDKTFQTIKEYAEKDNRIRILDKENGGVTSARLLGIKNANGDWIAFCDADDIVDSNMYEILINNAIEHNADISHCGYRMVFPSRTVFYHNSKVLITQNKSKGLQDLLAGELVEPGLWNKLYKKEIIDDFYNSGIIDLNIKINEDLLMNYYLFKLADKSVFHDICLYNYVVRSGSAANTKINEHHLLDPIKVRELIYNDCIKDSKINYFAKINYINTLINHATMPKKQNKELISKYQKDARKKLLKLFKSSVLDNNLSFLFRCKLSFAALFPDIYKLIHIIYSKITGLDKIYDIN